MIKKNNKSFYYILLGLIFLISALFSLFVKNMPTNTILKAYYSDKTDYSLDVSESIDFEFSSVENLETKEIIINFPYYSDKFLDVDYFGYSYTYSRQKVDSSGNISSSVSTSSGKSGFLVTDIVKEKNNGPINFSLSEDRTQFIFNISNFYKDSSNVSWFVKDFILTKINVERPNTFRNVFLNSVDEIFGVKQILTSSSNLDLKINDYIPKYKNFNFLGWSTKENDKDFIIGSVNDEFYHCVFEEGNEDINLYAIFEGLGNIDLTIKVIDCTELISFEDSEDIALETPTKNGCNFLGWSLENNNVTKIINDLTTINQDTTLYAVFEISNVRYNFQVYSMPDFGGPSKMCYEFLDFDYYHKLTLEDIENKFLNECFSLNNVYYRNNGIEYLYAPNTDYTTHNIEDFDFEFLYDEEIDRNVVNLQITLIQSSIWVDFYVDNLKTTKIFLSDEDIIFETPNKEGYTFVGWSTKENNKSFIVEDLNIYKGQASEGIISLYAVFFQTEMPVNFHYYLNNMVVGIKNIGNDCFVVSGEDGGYLGNNNVLDYINNFCENFFNETGVKVYPDKMGLSLDLLYGKYAYEYDQITEFYADGVDFYFSFSYVPYNLSINYFVGTAENYCISSLDLVYVDFIKKTNVYDKTNAIWNDFCINDLDVLIVGNRIDIGTDNHHWVMAEINSLENILFTQDGKEFIDCKGNIKDICTSKVALYYLEKTYSSNSDRYIFKLSTTISVDNVNNEINLSLNYVDSALIELDYYTFYKARPDDLEYFVSLNKVKVPYFYGFEINLKDFYDFALFEMDLNEQLLVNVNDRPFYDTIPYLKFKGWSEEFSIVNGPKTYVADYDFNSNVVVKYYDKAGKLIEENSSEVLFKPISFIKENSSILDCVFEAFRNQMLLRFGSLVNNIVDVAKFELYLNDISWFCNTRAPEYGLSKITPYFAFVQPKVKIDKVSNFQKFTCNLVSKSCLYVSGSYFNDNYLYVISPFSCDLEEYIDGQITITYGFLIGAVTDVEDLVNPDGEDSFVDELIGKFRNLLEKTWFFVKWVLIVFLSILILFIVIQIIKLIIKLCTKNKAYKPNKRVYTKSNVKNKRKRTRKK